MRRITYLVLFLMGRFLKYIYVVTNGKSKEIFIDRRDDEVEKRIRVKWIFEYIR